METYNFLGLNTQQDEAQIVLLPVCWDVTTSYGKGTYRGPSAIANASSQLDFDDYDFGDSTKKGIHMLPKSEAIEKHYRAALPFGQKVINYCHSHEFEDPTSEIKEAQQIVNEESQKMVDYVHYFAKDFLNQDKFFAVVGGDHSCPLGLIKALAEKYNGDFGVLHIDAHADLRNAYQGFTHSHASIMYNVLQLDLAPKKIVQVGIRDYCGEEKELIDSDSRIKTFFGPQLFADHFRGKSWQVQCEEIIHELPNNIYISFDIDGLDPEYCPNTGTPVPGGLSFSQAEHLLRVFKGSGKKIIGFDLCEVAPDPSGKDEWDGNVGARVLYKLCGLV
ncbi:MAG: agmatinase family protein [Bdellovibrionales bacterium]|nr:agmatinase family protein [Bdellovibrionales bacterium]